MSRKPPVAGDKVFNSTETLLIIGRPWWLVIDLLIGASGGRSCRRRVMSALHIPPAYQFRQDSNMVQICCLRIKNSALATGLRITAVTYRLSRLPVEHCHAQGSRYGFQSRSGALAECLNPDHDERSETALAIDATGCSLPAYSRIS